MEPTIIEQIEAANAQIQTLVADLTAANALLAEAQTKATADAETIRALTEQAGALANAANEAAATIAAKDAELADKAASLADLAAKLKDAEAKLTLAPFADTRNGIDPINTTVGESMTHSDALEHLKTISDPKEKRAFYLKHIKPNIG
jgi:chromosome segregation ATPase